MICGIPFVKMLQNSSKPYCNLADGIPKVCSNLYVLP